MAGLVGYGGDLRVVASRAEIERVSAHLHAVGAELTVRIFNFLPNPIERVQVDAALPGIEYRIHKTRLALAAAAENYLGAEAKVAHRIETIGHAIQKHPWLVHLVPKPVVDELRAAGLVAFGLAQLAPGNFGAEATRLLASTTDLAKVADSANAVGLLNDKKVSFHEVPSVDRPGVDSLATIGARIDDLNTAQRQIRIDTYQNAGSERTLVVFLPGTQNWAPLPSSNPFDATTDAQLATDPQHSELLKAVTSALNQSGAAGAHVILAGYSLGGIAAAQLATQGGFDVTGVVTVGSPVGQINIPKEIPVLSIQHINDPVPSATGQSNPLTENWATVSRHAPLPLISTSVSAHDIDRYRETLALVDQSNLPGVSRVRDLILNQFAGSKLVKAQTFEFSR